MASIDFRDIYSRFYTKVEAYDFLTLDDYQIEEFLCNWLHASVAKPYVHELFSSVVLEDDVGLLSYEMKYAFDEDTDMEFVTELLALGIGIEWLTPKVFSVVNTSNFFGSKEEKTFSPAAHLKTVQDALKLLKKEQRRIIADRGYLRNSYTDGDVPVVRP